MAREKRKKENERVRGGDVVKREIEREIELKVEIMNRE